MREKNTHMTVFHSVSGPICLKLKFESCENIAVSDAFLCPTDVMNKARMCGRSSEYVTSQPSFLFFVGSE